MGELIDDLNVKLGNLCREPTVVMAKAAANSARDCWSALYEDIIDQKPISHEHISAFLTLLVRCDAAMRQVLDLQNCPRCGERIRWYIKLLRLLRQGGAERVHIEIEQALDTLQNS